MGLSMRLGLIVCVCSCVSVCVFVCANYNVVAAIYYCKLILISTEDTLSKLPDNLVCDQNTSDEVLEVLESDSKTQKLYMQKISHILR